MLARTETDLAVVEGWLAQFERALSDCDDTLLKTLFCADSHWRDILALTWRIATVNGREAIVRELSTHGRRASPVSFKIPSHRTAPRLATRAGISSIEAIFAFETADGRGSGVVRLKAVG
jgi:putative flavoprotein involved in K+ transport